MANLDYTADSTVNIVAMMENIVEKWVSTADSMENIAVMMENIVAS